MTQHYRHTQYGWGIVIGLGGAAIAAGVVTAMIAEDKGPTWIPASITALLLLNCLLFCSLRVTISNVCIRLRFGIGLIGKSFAANEICEASIVRNHWYYGWGIKYTPHGWLFSVSGLDAVQIETTSGRTYRIGTDEPQQLHEAIQRASANSTPAF